MINRDISFKKNLFFCQILSHDLRARYCIKSSGNIGEVLSLSGGVRKGIKEEVPPELVLKDEQFFQVNGGSSE